ncbi:MAG: alpha-glucosidase C-terminal domain-containing protein, partial [Elusimicrobia bacterium]|nr:alpha-glucosidase C-terminal domain-containing protein [Elusimicrobiota bacterium]
MGDNIYLGDRNGVRTPMHWSSDRNAGFSAANAQRLYLPVIIDPEYHYEAGNVDVQQNNPQSLLWWMKRIIALRRRFAPVFGRGKLEMLQPENRRMLAFVRRFQEQDILVVANLSRFAQHAELDLAAFRGRVPVEMFGRNDFPPIGDQPYPVLLGPHAFYWFMLRKPAPVAVEAAPERPSLETPGRWTEALSAPRAAALAEILLSYLAASRTLGPKAKEALEARILEAIPFGSSAAWVLLQLEYDLPEQPTDVFSVPVAFVTGEAAADVERRHPAAVLARLATGQGAGLLVDAAAEPGFRKAILDILAGERRIAGVYRDILGRPAKALTDGSVDLNAESSVEWSPSGAPVLTYKDRYVLRFVRRLEPGPHPEVELGRFLTERRPSARVRPFAGHLELKSRRGPATVLATLHAFRPVLATGWRHALDSLGRYFESVLTRLPVGGERPAPIPAEPLVSLSEGPIPEEARELLGPFLQDAELLGKTIGEVHQALASAPEDPEFSPEPFTVLYQRELYQAMRTLTRQVGSLLRRGLRNIPEEARADAQRVVDLEGEVLKRFRAALQTKFRTSRVRCHGDFHLGRVLYTGKEFVITGFEGDETRSLGQRRIKRNPLRDVAAMLRSFHYAAASALYGPQAGIGVRPQDRAALEPWAQYWKLWVSAAFLKGYRASGAPSAFAPKREEFELLLALFLREQAVRELSHELRQRPDWARVALLGLPDLLASI